MTNLDEQVAVKVMGWTPHPVQGYLMENRRRRVRFSPSTSIADAMLVDDEMFKHGWRLQLHRLASGKREAVYCRLIVP